MNEDKIGFDGLRSVSAFQRHPLRRSGAALFNGIFLVTLVAGPGRAAEYDLLIQNARIADGTGALQFEEAPSGGVTKQSYRFAFPDRPTLALALRGREREPPAA